MDGNSAVYEETLEAPAWLRWVLLAALVLIISTIGVRIGAGTVRGDGIAAWIAALVSGAAFLFAYFNLLTLQIGVANGELTFAYGVVRHRVAIDQIESIEVDGYRWGRYGGWGYSRGSLGRRAWSMPGVSAGVVVVLHESGKRREYFVSSLAPLKLEGAIRAGMVVREAEESSE
ncbi:MAG: hypothetical protein QF554_01040 [Dehalococcoidia bacterium]|jgi:hypothetical protein|nr:hypothetical protein [Dehalococcoidia bacterium]